MLKYFVLALTFIFPAHADLFLTYSYFYACDSGVVDCDAFQMHLSGGFGMEGVPPLDAHNWTGGGMNVVASNASGEVVGWADGGFAWDDTPVYGQNGQVRCILGCPDNAGSGYKVIDINNNGFYLLQVYSDLYLGYGSDGRYLGLGAPTGIGKIVGFGLNDDNQILVDETINGQVVRGVLSPNSVPEPSGLILLTTILVAAFIGRSYSYHLHLVAIARVSHHRTP